MTFEDLCVLEPRLRELEREARAMRPDPHSPRVSEWAWGAFKRRIAKLVGFSRHDRPDEPLSAEHPLRSDIGYMAALRHFASLLGI